MRKFSKHRTIAIGIILLVAAIHIFRLGSYLQGDLRDLYYGYFSDIAIPFGIYFLLCATDEKTPLFKPWGIKFALVFLLPSFAETGQYFGIPVLGSTFDSLDYVMYAAGSLSAVIVDQVIFPRIFAFWSEKKPG